MRVDGMLTPSRYGVALMLVLLLAACGGPDNGPTPSDATTTSVTPAPTTRTVPSTEPVQYVPWGPDDPPIPGQYAALAASSIDGLNCDAVDQEAPQSPFWSTVVGVCRALKDDAEWPASPSFEPPPAANGFQDCLNNELADVLRALFAWRDTHPGAEPRIEYPISSARSPCQRRIYNAAVFEIPPDPMHPTGGVIVELNVPGLNDGDSSPEVLVDGNRVALEDDFSGGDDGLSFGQVYIPAPIDGHTATIEVKDSGYVRTTTVELPDVEAAEDGSPTTSPTTTP